MDNSLAMLPDEQKFRDLWKQNVAWVVLLVAQREKNPSEVTDLLGLLPNNTTKDGDRLNVEEHDLGFAQRSSWSLSSKGKVDGCDPIEHFRWLLNQLDGKSPAVHSLQEFGWEFNIRVEFRLHTYDFDFDLPVEVLKTLSELCIPLQIGQSFMGTRSEY